MSDLLISFVVPAYNEEALIASCLAAIQAEIARTGCRAEIIVVNNNSSDGTRRIASSLPGVVIVDEPQRGLVQARRAGCRAANGALIANIDADTILTEALEPMPTDAYGQSKLAAERGLAELDLDWVSLRAALVYGPGVKGNMAQLMRLARSPFPLPLASLTTRRSLLALENLSAAIETVLAAPGTLRRVFIAADPQALTMAEMIAALRGGLGRRPNVFPLPPALLGLLLRAAGQEETYRRLSGSLIADPSALMSLGWAPPLATPAGLAKLIRANGE